MATNTYVALDKVTVGTATNTVTFNSINQGYTDLVVVCNLAISSGTGNSKIQFNSDTGSNYSETTLEGTGSTAVSSRYTSNTSIILEGSGFLSTTFQTVKTIHLMNYSNTTTNKTCLVRNGGASAGVDAIVGLWRNTGAVTSFTISTTASTFVSGSTFSLYGIAATSVGAKATGGTVYSDSQYYYHVFPSSGTFTPLQSLSADILCVAGGGGAGYYGGGGGGAGGLQYASAQSLTATNYTITIGAGGASKSGSSGGNGTVGVDSSFASVVIAKGGGYGAGSQTTGVAGGNGGSGGGGGGVSGTPAGGSAVAGTGGTHYGNAGGANGSYAGSGGGAGAAGTSGGAGGNGTSAFSSWGAVTGTGQNVSGTYYYAGGGESNRNAGGGGLGGGGAWLNSGTANTGGGGGADQNGGGGGSGIVIVRYAK